jgi:hypothetical protein
LKRFLYICPLLIQNTAEPAAEKRAKNMKNTNSISDFSFNPSGYGHYKVIFKSPVTGKEWKTITSDMPLIDATKNSDSPKIKDLNQLKKICKR